MMWQPKQGKRNKGRQVVIYTDMLMGGTGIHELRTAMEGIEDCGELMAAIGRD